MFQHAWDSILGFSLEYKNYEVDSVVGFLCVQYSLKL